MPAAGGLPPVDGNTRLRPPVTPQQEARAFALLSRVRDACCMCELLPSAAVAQTTTCMIHLTMQVAHQRWLTVGAIVLVGGAGLLAADAVRSATRRHSRAAATQQRLWLCCATTPFVTPLLSPCWHCRWRSCWWGASSRQMTTSEAAAAARQGAGVAATRDGVSVLR